VRAYRNALQAKPGYYPALNNLAVLYAELGMGPQAQEAFEAATRASPEDPVAWRNLGVQFARSGQAVQAATAFEQALALRPGDPDFLFRLGLVEADRGNWDRLGAIAAELDRVDQARAKALRARIR